MDGYWKEQPVKLGNNIAVIEPKPVEKKTRLPFGFTFVTLVPQDVGVIKQLLDDHYVQDPAGLLMIRYGKEFLFWYLNQVYKDLLIGLVYEGILVGMITAWMIEMNVCDKDIMVPYVNLLCVQKNLRKLKLGVSLIDEVKYRLCQMKIILLDKTIAEPTFTMGYALFTSMAKPTNHFSSTKDYIIPINMPKLKSLGYEHIDEWENESFLFNPLHLLQTSDVEDVMDGLNAFSKKFFVKHIFVKPNMLLPKKDIIYSFVIKNKGKVTDFINVYKHFYYYKEQQQYVTLAQLGFYFYSSVSLTDLVKYLIDKLNHYGFDQLVIRNMADNDYIQLNKLTTNESLYYFFYNIEAPSIAPRYLSVIPI